MLRTAWSSPQQQLAGCPHLGQARQVNKCQIKHARAVNLEINRQLGDALVQQSKGSPSALLLRVTTGGWGGQSHFVLAGDAERFALDLLANLLKVGKLLVHVQKLGVLGAGFVEGPVQRCMSRRDDAVGVSWAADKGEEQEATKEVDVQCAEELAV